MLEYIIPLSGWGTAWHFYGTHFCLLCFGTPPYRTSSGEQT